MKGSIDSGDYFIEIPQEGGTPPHEVGHWGVKIANLFGGLHPTLLISLRRPEGTDA